MPLRKIVWSIQVTVDGFIDHTAMIADEETHQYYANELETTDLVVFGRKTYQLIADYWPTAAQSETLNPGELAFANRINTLRKIVFSQTLGHVAWNNTQLNRGNVIDQIATLKQDPGHEISISGGAIANDLMRHDLIDEYRFLVNPVILGSGTRLFRDGIPIKLKRVGTRNFASGCILLTYEPIRKIA